MNSWLKKSKGPGWTKMYWRVIRDPNMSAAAKVIFHIVKSYADKDGADCFPSAALVCRASGFCRDTVFKCFKEIEEVGWFKRVQRLNGSNVFILMDEEWSKVRVKVEPAETFRRRKKQTDPRRKKSDTTKIQVPANVIEMKKQKSA